MHAGVAEVGDEPCREPMDKHSCSLIMQHAKIPVPAHVSADTYVGYEAQAMGLQLWKPTLAML